MTVPLSGGAVDLSRQAIAARRRTPDAATGRELVARAAETRDAADAILTRAHRLHPGKMRDALERRAKHAAATAAAQIRLAAMCPLDRGYLHALAHEQIQRVQAEVLSLVADDDPHQWASLQVETHRRVAEQRERIRAEGAPS